MTGDLRSKLLAVIVALSLSPLANAAIVFDVDATTGPLVGQLTSGTINVFLDVSPPHENTTAGNWVARLLVTASGGASLSDITLGNAVQPAGDIWPAGFHPSTDLVGPDYTVSHNPPNGSASLIARSPLFSVPFTIEATAPSFSSFDFDIILGGGASLQTTGVYATDSSSLGATFDASPEFTLTVIPEPSTMLATAIAIAASGFVGYRKRKRAE